MTEERHPPHTKTVRHERDFPLGDQWYLAFYTFTLDFKDEVDPDILAEIAKRPPATRLPRRGGRYRALRDIEVTVQILHALSRRHSPLPMGLYQRTLPKDEVVRLDYEPDPSRSTHCTLVPENSAGLEDRLVDSQVEEGPRLRGLLDLRIVHRVGQGLRVAGDSVAIVGGGLAGLAAAEAASRAGLRVELFEARRQLGGRAGSFFDPATGQWVDRCQHVAMGCCTNLAEFCRRTGSRRLLRAPAAMALLRPHAEGPGRRDDLAAVRLAPGPAAPPARPAAAGVPHASASAWGIVRTLGRLMPHQGDRSIFRPGGQSAKKPSDRKMDQPPAGRAGGRAVAPRPGPVGGGHRAVLGPDPDQRLGRHARSGVALGCAQGVLRRPVGLGRCVRDALALRAAGRAVRSPRGAARLARGRDRSQGPRAAGGRHAERVEGLVLADGTTHEADFFVLAVPWHRVAKILAPPLVAALPGLAEVGRLEPVPIAAAHFWFDRPITRLAHAVLVGRLGQWVFRRPDAAQYSYQTHHGDTQRTETAVGETQGPRYYYQVVISAAHGLRGADRGQTIGACARSWPAYGPRPALPGSCGPGS